MLISFLICCCLFLSFKLQAYFILHSNKLLCKIKQFIVQTIMQFIIVYSADYNCIHIKLNVNSMAAYIVAVFWLIYVNVIKYKLILAKRVNNTFICIIHHYSLYRILKLNIYLIAAIYPTLVQNNLCYKMVNSDIFEVKMC